MQSESDGSFLEMKVTLPSFVEIIIIQVVFIFFLL